jgi:serine/threonine protein kinase
VSTNEEPQQFGDYHLLERIATGGMAEVWRARAYGMAGFEKILVIKRVLDALSKDEEFIGLFIDEARIAVQLLHVNIVQVFDLGEVNGAYYMAMEYVHGLDLARLVNRSGPRGPLPIAITLFVITEVLKALQFAHARTDEAGTALHIVHCDISPQNVLISYAGEVKITDFGISRAAFQAKGVHDVVRGKYAYMSPEQVDGSVLDGRSDVFSLGIVMFELLTGRRLFKAKNREATLARVRRAEIPPIRKYREDVSEDLEAIVLRMLAQKADDRYPDAGYALDDISGLMVREGHRATNSDLAVFVRDTVERPQARPEEDGHAAVGLVVLAVEASPPPRSLSTPATSLAQLTQEWAGVITEADGEVWERSSGSMLVCWTRDFDEAIKRAVDTSVQLKRVTERAGYSLSAGVAPGVARLNPHTERPPEGWELAGPFYLARWMMNLSAHRGRLLLTDVGARNVPQHRTLLLGRISILGNRFINLYELGQ